MIIRIYRHIRMKIRIMKHLFQPFNLYMAAELLRRCRIVVVCGTEVDEQVKNDIALAKRQHIVATTLDGILTVDGKCKKKGQV